MGSGNWKERILIAWAAEEGQRRIEAATRGYLRVSGHHVARNESLETPKDSTWCFRAQSPWSWSDKRQLCLNKSRHKEPNSLHLLEAEAWETLSLLNINTPSHGKYVNGCSQGRCHILCPYCKSKDVVADFAIAFSSNESFIELDSPVSPWKTWSYGANHPYSQKSLYNFWIPQNIITDSLTGNINIQLTHTLYVVRVM